MNKKAIYGIVLAALLGGTGFLYWDDIAPLIGMAPAAPPVVARQAADTAPARPAEPTVEEYQGKIGDILGAIWNREGAFLFGSINGGFEADIKKFAVAYPQEMKRKNLNLTGKLLWSHADDWSEYPCHAQLEGEPVGRIIICSGKGGQVQDVAASRSYAGAVIVERFMYEMMNPLLLFPASYYGFKVTKVEAGEEGIIKLTLEPPARADSGFFAVRQMTIEVRGEQYELVSYTLKLFIDGKIVTHTARWQKDGDNFRISTDNGTLVVKGERTDEQMVLACAGDNPATYTFTYGDSAVTGIAVALKHDGIDYSLELAEISALDDFPGEAQVTVGAAFKNAAAASEWATAKLGWADPASVAAPEEEGAEGEAGDTTAMASAEAGADTAASEEEQPAEGDEDPNAEPEQEAATTTAPAREERATASASRTARQQTPREEPEEPAAEEPAAAPARTAAARATTRPAATVAPTRTTASTPPTTAGATTTTVRRASAPTTTAYTRGVAAYRAGRHLEAETQLLTAVRQQPGNATAQLMLGEIYYGRGDYGRAHAYLSRAAQLSSQSWIGTRARQLLQRMGYPY